MNKPSIFLLEEDNDSRLPLNKLLKDKGYKVMSSDNREDALQRTMEQRLARWLLMSHDRSIDDNLPLTQDFLSIMLGVNRPSVTLAAVHLQSAGFIKYSRGLITVTDREALEDFSCECYQRVKDDYDRLPK